MTKIELHTHCCALLEARISRLEHQINDAQQAASDDTKSSAGDKFETSREMMKREIDKYNLQLTQADKQLRMLRQLKPGAQKTKVEPGSLVQTNEGWYYFSVPLGKLSLAAETFFALSLVAPIGQALKGQAVGANITFMGRQIEILGIE